MTMPYTYSSFIQSKRTISKAAGMEPPELHRGLFPFQADIVRWALRRGRACIFADCGMGKTRMQLEWARHVPGRVLILAPLAVAGQTVAEASEIDMDVRYCRSGEAITDGVTVTNYEMLDRFDPSVFSGVVLDEPSILKSYMGKTKRAIIDRFRNTPWKLACTATPAPNDHMEIGNHCEFIGEMSSSEMLSAFFINDPAHVGRYRIKGHAERRFWEWMASWCVMIRKPSDLGYPDDGFILPPIQNHWHEVACHAKADGQLFALPAASLQERIAARRVSVAERVGMAVDLANATDDPWLIWCGLNDESARLAKAIDGAVEVVGSDSIEFKEQAMMDFVGGKVRVLVSKPSICGFGMNFQHCAHMAHVGLSDSWEEYYQAVRRCWRFGQKRTVHSHVITSSLEGAVVDNIRRKEADAARMAESVVAHMREISSGQIQQTRGFKQTYTPCEPLRLPAWLAT